VIRFHLDQHVARWVARALRRRGIDVTTAAEAGLQDADDALHVAFARREGRALVTHDRDYLVLRAQGVPHAGLCYCHQQSRTPQQVLDMLLLIHACYDDQEMMGRVEYL
jgi:predicted nuclease of predicted toxin-antitoxin system